MEDEVISTSDSVVISDLEENTDSSENIDLDENTDLDEYTSVDIIAITDELKVINQSFDFLFTVQVVQCSLILSILIFLAFSYIFKRFK